MTDLQVCSSLFVVLVAPAEGGRSHVKVTGGSGHMSKLQAAVAEVLGNSRGTEDAAPVPQTIRRNCLMHGAVAVSFNAQNQH